MKRRHRPEGRPCGSAERVALPCFQKEHWPRWLEIADDRESWPATFEEWQRESNDRAERLSRAGLEIVWVDLEPDSFAAWCESRGYENDAEARNRFAAEQVGNIPPPQQAGPAPRESTNAE